MHATALEGFLQVQRCGNHASNKLIPTLTTSPKTCVNHKEDTAGSLPKGSVLPFSRGINAIYVSINPQRHRPSAPYLSRTTNVKRPTRSFQSNVKRPTVQATHCNLARQPTSYRHAISTSSSTTKDRKLKFRSVKPCPNKALMPSDSSRTAHMWRELQIADQEC